MKAQDYIDQYLPQINEATDEKQLKDICASVKYKQFGNRIFQKQASFWPH